MVAADLIESCGGRLAEFDDETLEKLKNLLPPLTLRENPVDLSFSGLDVNLLQEVVEVTAADPDVGLMLFCYAVAPPSWVIPEDVLAEVFSIEKPCVFVYSSDPADFKAKKSKLNTVIFNSVERAARAVARVQNKK